MVTDFLIHAASHYGTSLTVTSYAKVNLSLIITGRRDDGYHELHSHVVFCHVGDRLTFTPTPDKDVRLYVSGAFGAPLRPHTHDNVIMKVALALQDRTDTSQGALIHVQKMLPLASGIGGGSGDAAQTLRMLNWLWDCQWDHTMLAELGEEFGADIPVCVHGASCVMHGIGDKLSPLEPEHRVHGWLVLVTPPVEVPTAHIFSLLPTSLYERDPNDTHDLCQMHDPCMMQNDLEEVALEHYPIIAPILAELRHHPHTLTARLSGSGATCFALCIGRSDAQSLAEYMQIRFPDAWVRYGVIV